MKQKKRAHVGDLYVHKTSGEELIYQVQNYIATYGKDVLISLSMDDGYPFAEVSATVEETDSEYMYRLLNEEAQKERLRENESNMLQALLRYIELKKKYETNLPKAG